jgi:hypothetical protein
MAKLKSSNMTKPGPSIQLQTRLHVPHALTMPYTTMAQLKMKTQPKQLLDSLPLDIALRATFKPTGFFGVIQSVVMASVVTP